MRRRRRRRRRRTIVIKSNNPHLAGGEFQFFCLSLPFLGWFGIGAEASCQRPAFLTQDKLV